MQPYADRKGWSPDVLLNERFNILKFQSENYLLLIFAAYHPCGHLFVQNLVTKLNLVSEAMKHRVLLSLGADVDNLSRSKHGMLVLKGLENVIN